jgi:hypothetical protein
VLCDSWASVKEGGGCKWQCVRCGSWWTMTGVSVLIDGRQAQQWNLCSLPNMPELLAGVQ